jgi:membrane associated rhomboid family serine protease
MIPYQADVMMARVPWANWIIIGVTVLISLIVIFANADVSQFELWRSDAGPFLASLLKAHGIKDFDVADVPSFHVYQLVSHAFLHAGLIHLFGNMIFLFVFGNAVNAKIGHVPYVALYLAFAVFTGLAWFFLPGSGAVLVGASGAIMGITGMFAILYPLNEISIFTFILLRPTIFEFSAMWVLLFYFAMDFLGFLGGGGNVAHVSHLAGMSTGAVLTAALVLTGRVKPNAGEKTLLEVFGMKVARIERPRPVRPPIVPLTGREQFARPVPPKPPSADPRRWTPPGGW